jgi:hypothetical protein
MDGLVRLWSMTALEVARSSGQTRTRPAPGETDLPARLGKAGAWARWMARRDPEAESTPSGLASPDGARA